MGNTTTKESIRVVIVDDHGIVRQGLRALLTRPGIQVVGEEESGSGAVKALSSPAVKAAYGEGCTCC